MRAERAGTIVARLETLFGAGRDAVDDGALLDRFARSRDEAAFRCLVERHGARVWSVCRRSLLDSHAAEDAFQATFLVLARRAGQIERPDRLAAWLAGVAQRAARKLRTSQLRRWRHERTAAVPASALSPQRACSVDTWELRAILDEELDRLPEPLRRAVELCYVEGRTTDEAAELLGCPRGTVGTRVARGRDRLKRGLERRGMAPALILGAPLVVPPTPLVASAIRAAVPFAANCSAAGPASGTVPAAAVALAHSLLGSFAMQKTVLIAALILAPLLAGGALLATRPANAVLGTPGPAARAFAADDMEALQGTWAPIDVKFFGQAPKDAEEQIKSMRFRFEKNTFIVQLGEEKPLESRIFSLDAQKNPRRLKVEGNGENGFPRNWIYELKDKQLRMAAAEGQPEDSAPARFDEKPENAHSMLVMTLVPESQAPKPTPEQLEKLKATRLSATRAVSMNNLKQIGLAFHNAASSAADGKTTAFPAATIRGKDGTPLLSWRVAVLPYLAQDALYRQFHLDEPWDGPHNKELIAKMPRVYASTNDLEPGKTFYRGVVGPDAALQADQPTAFSEIRDGTSNTILVVEAGPPVEWTRPDDLTLDPGKPVPSLTGPFADGIQVLFADGSVRLLEWNNLDAAARKALTTRSGGEIFDLAAPPRRLRQR
jgi:RNA polymerase sigma-70 factor (ECF subfamily)